MAFSKLQIYGRMARRVFGSVGFWGTALGGAFCLTVGGFLVFPGYALLALAGWKAIKPLTIGRNELFTRALSDVRRQRQKQHTRHLRKLLPNIRKDRDPRTTKILKDLERIHERMLRLESASIDTTGMSTLLIQANELYDSCLESLERSIQLWAGASDMATDEARNKLLAERDKTVVTVEKSIGHLDASLDHIQTAALKATVTDDGNHKQLRDELQIGLDVAREVEKSIDEIERIYEDSERA